MIVAAGALLPGISWAGPLAGRRLPSFTLPDTNMKSHDSLDYRGKPLLLEVMQTACAHCKASAPNIERVRAKYAGKIAVLSIVLPPDTQTTVAQFAAAYHVGSPILFDCGQATAAILQIKPQSPKVDLPQLVLVDAAGIIRDDWGWSEATKDVFEGQGLDVAIDAILKKK